MLTRVGAAMGYYQLFKIKPLFKFLITKFCDMTWDMCFTYPIDSKENSQDIKNQLWLILKT